MKGIKTINVPFNEEEHDLLLIKKGKEPWRDYILRLAGVKKKS